MAWKFDTERPIYTQLLEYIQMQIISGEYKPGDKLPTVRELAQAASVNPNTVQKALTELERTGLVFAQRTAGRFITEDQAMIDGLKKDMAAKQIKVFLEKMSVLGYDLEEIAALIVETGREIKA